MLVPVAEPKLGTLPACKRICNWSEPVKLLFKLKRTRSEKVILSSISVPVPLALSSPKGAPRLKIASPTNFVVVENWFASNSAVRASKASTRPRKVASSAENSSCKRCRVAKSSLVTNSAVAVAISSLTRSKQAFKPAANS